MIFFFYTSLSFKEMSSLNTIFKNNNYYCENFILDIEKPINPRVFNILPTTFEAIKFGVLNVNIAKKEFADYNFLRAFFNLSKKIIIKNYTNYDIPMHDNIKIIIDDLNIDNNCPVLQFCTFKVVKNLDNKQIENIQKCIDDGIIKKLYLARNNVELFNISKLEYLKIRVTKTNIKYLINRGFYNIQYSLILNSDFYDTEFTNDLKLLMPNICGITLCVNGSIPNVIFEILEFAEQKLKFGIYGPIFDKNKKGELYNLLENKDNIQISKKNEIFPELAKQKRDNLHRFRFLKVKQAQ